MSIPAQAVVATAKKLYEHDTREELGAAGSYNLASDETRRKYMRRASVAIDGYLEWLHKGPTSGR